MQMIKYNNTISLVYRLLNFTPKFNKFKFNKPNAANGYTGYSRENGIFKRFVLYFLNFYKTFKDRLKYICYKLLY